jgi:hypothetical protein
MLALVASAVDNTGLSGLGRLTMLASRALAGDNAGLNLSLGRVTMLALRASVVSVRFFGRELTPSTFCCICWI